eukprot:5086862-Pyramimonas_sp.AAC.1
MTSAYLQRGRRCSTYWAPDTSAYLSLTRWFRGAQRPVESLSDCLCSCCSQPHRSCTVCTCQYWTDLAIRSETRENDYEEYKYVIMYVLGLRAAC